MVFVVIATVSGVLALIDAVLDYNCVELLVGKKKDFDLIGCFYKFGFVLFVVFMFLSLFFTAAGYSSKYDVLCNRQKKVSEQYLLSNKTAEDWAWVCTEMNAINEEMKELEESKEQRSLWDFSAYWSSYDYETYSAEIAETTINFNAERHLIPLRYENDDAE